MGTKRDREFKNGMALIDLADAHLNQAAINFGLKEAEFDEEVKNDYETEQDFRLDTEMHIDAAVELIHDAAKITKIRIS